jgi:acyl carrier protein
MGLDGVEMVMAIEEAFDIQIEDSEAEKLVTPRMVIDCVLSKVAVANSTACLTQRAFNLFRKALLRDGGLKRSDITPGARLSLLIPKTHRTGWIQKFMPEMGIKERLHLTRPNWLTAVLFGIAVLAGLAAAVFIPVFHAFQALLLFAGVAILTGIAGAAATRNQRSEFPSEARSVAHISRWIMSHKPDLAGISPSAWTRDQIAARVREIVIETLACESNYSEDAHFVKDLGLN